MLKHILKRQNAKYQCKAMKTENQTQKNREKIPTMNNLIGIQINAQFVNTPETFNTLMVPEIPIALSKHW